MIKKRVYFIIVLVVFGILALVNCSGYAATVDLNGKTQVFLSALVLIPFAKSSKTIVRKSYNRKKLYFMIFLTGWYIIVSWALQKSWQGYEYITYLMGVYIVSQIEWDNANLKITSWIYMGLSLGLGCLCNYGTILKGWNPNTLSIIIFQLYCIYVIATGINETDTKFKKIVFICLAVFMVILINTLESRSAQMCVILSIVLCFRMKWTKITDRFFKSKTGTVIMILMPLFVALITAYIGKLPIAQMLNTWSMETFKKPIFNGRDAIWEHTLNKIYKSPIWGYGNIAPGFYHNSALTALVAYGAIGYGLYVIYLYKAIRKCIPYWNDTVIRRAIIIFYILNFQQSFENTIFQVESMILIPYIILGMMEGRVQYIERQKQIKNQRNSAGIQYGKVSPQMLEFINREYNNRRRIHNNRRWLN